MAARDHEISHAFQGSPANINELNWISRCCAVWGHLEVQRALKWRFLQQPFFLLVKCRFSSKLFKSGLEKYILHHSVFVVGLGQIVVMSLEDCCLIHVYSIFSAVKSRACDLWWALGIFAFLLKILWQLCSFIWHGITMQSGQHDLLDGYITLLQASSKLKWDPQEWKHYLGGKLPCCF